MRGAALLLALCLVWGAAFGADGAELANPDLDELSGLAVSRADATLLWGHNDTGGGQRLFRIGLDGADLGSVRVDGAQSSDWEDIAAFEDAGGPALLIADTGDNFGLRSWPALYAVRDPGRRGKPALLWRLDFRYPDGARDCEALAVDPVDRVILLVSKRDARPRLYRLALPDGPPPPTAARPTAEFIGEVAGVPPAPGLGRLLTAPQARFDDSPTALDISRDGRTAVLVTPRNAYVYRRAAGMDWAQTLGQPPAVVPLPDIDQVEAAALSADGRALFVGGEGRPGRLARIALPQ
jgi:hypothetical protein